MQHGRQFPEEIVCNQNVVVVKQAVVIKCMNR